MEKLNRLPEDAVVDLRALAHDLSNSLETILQASYLLSQAKLDPDCKKWLRMVETASHDAVNINRKFREILRSGTEA